MSCHPSIFASFSLIMFVVCVNPAVQARASEPGPAKLSDGFKAMLTAVDAAQLELQNGRPASFKALWSHADDITLSGGLGGTIERGWEQISRRLDWVGTQFSMLCAVVKQLDATGHRNRNYSTQLSLPERWARGPIGNRLIRSTTFRTTGRRLRIGFRNANATA